MTNISLFGNKSIDSRNWAKPHVRNLKNHIPKIYHKQLLIKTKDRNKSHKILEIHERKIHKEK